MIGFGVVAKNDMVFFGLELFSVKYLQKTEVNEKTKKRGRGLRG
jgi:hypothetical protein